jgi:hypothetical protein
MTCECDPLEEESKVPKSEKEVFMPPFGAIARPMSSYGHTLGGSQLINDENKAVVCKLIDTILKSPLSRMQLSDRVYELLTSEIRSKKERSKTYQGRL